ncbi:uncharacterized protein DS421_10g294020 [Arachis hypogaea]|nr:uncharacterized protein DS421_10g294020 [Arachis hypogaea]
MGARLGSVAVAASSSSALSRSSSFLVEQHRQCPSLSRFCSPTAMRMTTASLQRRFGAGRDSLLSSRSPRAPSLLSFPLCSFYINSRKQERKRKKETVRAKRKRSGEKGDREGGGPRAIVTAVPPLRCRRATPPSQEGTKGRESDAFERERERELLSSAPPHPIRVAVADWWKGGAERAQRRRSRSSLPNLHRRDSPPLKLVTVAVPPPQREGVTRLKRGGGRTPVRRRSQFHPVAGVVFV